MNFEFFLNSNYPSHAKGEPEHHKDLRSFQDSLSREFDQKRLELLEDKDYRIERLKEEIEQEVVGVREVERKRVEREQEERVKELRERLQGELEKEREALRRKQAEVLAGMQREFEDERQLRREKCAMQISTFMSSGQSLEQMDENEEKREIAVCGNVFLREYFF